MQNNQTEKKVWNAPQVVVYGDMAALTQLDAVKPKQPGSLDDFNVAGISNA